MVVSKTSVVNCLFVLSFSFYGLGFYASRTGNYSLGTMVSLSPLLIIILFFFVDALLANQFPKLVNYNYFLVLLFTFFCVYSLFVGLKNAVPGRNLINTVTLSFFIAVLTHSTLIVQHYNRKNPHFSIAHLLYWGLTLLIVVNLLGWLAGFRNTNYSTPGRLDLPFGPGIYFAAHTVAVINALIVGQWLAESQTVRQRSFSVLQFGANLAIMYLINSRIAILTFGLVAGILLLKLIRFYRLVYLAFLFTIPLLLNFSLLIWNVISQPIFVSVLQNRVAFETVTTFNGRRYIWEEGIDWLLRQGEGFFWGNGFRGHYTIDLLSDLHEGWDIWEKYDLHMHSTTLEFLLCQGVIGTAPLFLLAYLALYHCTRQHLARSVDASLIGALLYVLFVMQIDFFAYINNIGFYIFFVIVSAVVVPKKYSALN